MAMEIKRLSLNFQGALYSTARAASLHFFTGLKRLRALAAQGLDRVCHSALVGAAVSPKEKGGDSFFFLHYRFKSRNWQEPFCYE
jgi:hypothetical protein